MNISALYYDYYDKSGEEYNQINNFVTAGLLYIIGHYFSNLSSYFVLTMCCRNNHTCNYFDVIFSKMFAEWKEWPLQIVIVNKKDYKKMQGDYQYNIIFTDSYESFLQVEIHTYTSEQNKNEYYFIFLKTWDSLAAGEIQKIFEYCWHHYLINCVIQIQKENGRVLIYTYFPFTESYCGQVETVLVNEYNGTSLIHEDLFLKKLQNFYGCPLRAALFHLPPYMCLSTDLNNVTYVSGGFEGKLLLELSKKLNFSLDIIVPPNESKRGFIMMNGSIDGALKMLHDRQADLSMGGTRQTRARMMLLTASTPYYQTMWAVVTLSEAYNLTSLEIFMFPFANNIWYLLAFTSLSVLAIVTLLKLILPKYLVKQLDHVTLDILLMAMGMPAFNKAVFSTTRTLKTTWIMFSLVLRTSYQALLFHLIRTHDIRNTPETLRELVEQNFTLIVEKHTFEGLKNLAIFKTINFIVMNTTDHKKPLAYFEKMPLNKARYMAVALPLLRFEYYIQKHKKINVFKVLPQNIMNVKLSIYFSKHSFLVEQFNDILMIFKGFGIMEAWLVQEIDVDFIKNTHSEGNQIFGIKQLEMSFVLIFVGHMMATCVFILELLYKIKRSKT